MTDAECTALLRLADQRITELCLMVNVLAGFRKVRADDYAAEFKKALQSKS